jgi:hypothetical protein
MQSKRSLPRAQNTATESVIKPLSYDYPTIILPFMHNRLTWLLPLRFCQLFLYSVIPPQRLDRAMLLQLITVLIFGVMKLKST